MCLIVFPQARESGHAQEVAKSSVQSQQEAKVFIAMLMGGDEVAEDGGDPTPEEMSKLASHVRGLSSDALSIVAGITGAPSEQVMQCTRVVWCLVFVVLSYDVAHLCLSLLACYLFVCVFCWSDIDPLRSVIPRGFRVADAERSESHATSLPKNGTAITFSCKR